MIFWVVVLVVLWSIQVSIVFVLTNKILDAIKDASLLDHGRVVYESDDTGTLTVYADNAILELIDGTVVVIPKMQEAHDE